MHADKDHPDELSGGIFSRALTGLKAASLDSADRHSYRNQVPVTVRTMRPAPPAGGHDARVARVPAVRVSASRRSPAMPKTVWRWGMPSRLGVGSV